MVSVQGRDIAPGRWEGTTCIHGYRVEGMGYHNQRECLSVVMYVKVCNGRVRVFISPGGGGGGGRLGSILGGMCEHRFFKRPILKVFNILKKYP